MNRHLHELRERGVIRELPLPSPLQSRGVEVWVGALNSSAVPDPSWQQFLSSDERARADRFLLPAPRTSYMISRALLRLLIAERIGIGSGHLQFTYTSKGKPLLQIPASTLRFNLSHSAGLALIALSDGIEIGVDLERADRHADFNGIAATCFAAGEQALLGQLPSLDQGRAFFKIWTRKEAVLKATGQGITGGLRTPDVSANLLPGDTTLTVEFNGATWAIHDLSPDEGYIGALALNCIRG